MKFSSLAISILFIIVTFGSSLRIAGTISYYALFTDDFVERFCENKMRPELKCDGKCVLSQMLLQEADDERSAINLDWLKNETILFVDALFLMEFLQSFASNSNNLQYCNLYDFSVTERIIHPPQV